MILLNFCKIFQINKYVKLLLLSSLSQLGTFLFNPYFFGLKSVIFNLLMYLFTSLLINIFRVPHFFPEYQYFICHPAFSLVCLSFQMLPTCGCRLIIRNWLGFLCSQIFRYSIAETFVFSLNCNNNLLLFFVCGSSIGWLFFQLRF